MIIRGKRNGRERELNQFSTLPKKVRIIMKSPYDPSNFSNDIIEAIWRGNIDNVKALIDQSPDLVNKMNRGGQLPLIMAADQGNIEIVKFLIINGAHIDAVGEWKRTALHATASSGNGEIAKLLLDRGASMEPREERYLYTPLHIAAMKGNFSVAELLISRRADVNAKDSYGNTPLHNAVKGHRDVWMSRRISRDAHLKITKLLLDKGSYVNSKNNTGNTPMHYVSSKEIADLLIKKRANIREKNCDGDTPLHSAIVNDFYEVTELLISKKVDINAINIHGDTPLKLSIRHGKESIISLLRKHRAKE